MLGLFGRTLLPGGKPSSRALRATRAAARCRRSWNGTRKLTAAWCVFFTAQLAGSALLLAFGSLESWSLFINVLSFPLVGLMFAGDYLYRVIRYRHLPQSSIATAIQAYRRTARRASVAR